MLNAARQWLRPPRPSSPEVLTDRRERRALTLEIVLVLAITLGLSAARSLVSLADALLQPEALAEQEVALHAPRASLGVLDLLAQLLGVVQLLAWAGLGLYLLWRAGFALARIGIDARRRGADTLAGFALAAVIGIPGLGLYLLGWWLGISLAVLPSTLDEAWWRAPVLIASALANAAAEEILVVGYLLTRLRQLGFGENAALLVSAVLRGAYHLYQGFGGFIGNVLMGLIFGRYWQRTNRLLPLILAHTLIDVVAFVGYSLLRETLTWLP